VYALGLDFGAVDILRDDEGKWYVLEINTAPGIADQSAVTMGDAIRELAHGA
jgi:D-alanine-D-alanine ligase-like ATP-grasp enzyme